ncbi:MAG: ATP-binding cassette domain-containing protein [Eubacteriaceae bacterium]|nr:ATP-binding cassette domain-containing protein [Eubacteriaceae bacterium]
MIEITGLTKTFKTSEGVVEALKDVDLSIADGDIYGIIGMSGAGKSTLVRCINMLEKPDSGKVVIDGVDITALDEKALRTQRKHIAMIFQGFNLLMQRSVIDNVCFPMELSGILKSQAKARALELLDTVGLKDKANDYPARLSGGQQQRVAIARALAMDPTLLLCDEATSALDPTTTNSILSLIKDINIKLGITAVVITHQMSVVESICNRVAILDMGRVVEEGYVEEVFSHPKTEAARKLVFPESEDGGEMIIVSESEQHLIRIVFNGEESTGRPVIAQMAVLKGIEANISYASTRNIGGKVYGSMILGIPGGEETVNEALGYFKSLGVEAQEVKRNA